jgi:hypothetical protein
MRFCRVLLYYPALKPAETELCKVDARLRQNGGLPSSSLQGTEYCRQRMLFLPDSTLSLQAEVFLYYAKDLL